MIYIVIFVWFFAFPAHAWQEMKLDESGFTMSSKDLVPKIEDYVDTPEGAVNWELFAATKEITINEKDEEGYDLEYVQPQFADTLKKLDGEKIKIKGFMFPLEQGKEQSKFLFGPFPMNCPYHYHVGPSLVIEVHTKTPLPITFDPVTLSGTLELVERDIEFSVFYRLQQATQE